VQSRQIKRNVLVVSLMMLLTLLAGSSGSTALGAPKVREFVFAITMDDSGIDRALTQTFAQRVNDLSGGKMKINLFMGGVLGDTRELIELMKLGEVDFGYYAEFAAIYCPQLDATSVPFLWPDAEAVEEFLSGPVGDKIKQQVREKGKAVLLGPFHSYGSRWTTTNKPFRNAQELKGLKIRLPNMTWWVEVWQAMGAAPTPIAASEIVSALKTGVVDAQENFLSNIYGRGLYEVQKYAVATNHIDFYLFWAASERTWNSLNEQERKIVAQAAREAVDTVNPQIDEMNKGFVKSLEAKGVQIIYPDRDNLARAARPAIERIIARDLAPEVRSAVTKYMK
jgi:tripartite ATP-independent transporter DctP family solute receptor